MVTPIAIHKMPAQRLKGCMITTTIHINDVTARDLQKVDGQWSRAKGFDTFCPIGPAIKEYSDNLDINRLRIRSFLNGKVKQDSNTENMIFRPFNLISYISRIMTLYPGDIIATGTPAGIGEMKPGDRIEVDIENIGRLINHVASK